MVARTRYTTVCDLNRRAGHGPQAIQTDYCRTDYDCREGQACVNNICTEDYQQKDVGNLAIVMIAPVGIMVTVAGAMFAMAIIMSTMAFISTPRKHAGHKVARGAWRKHPHRPF